MFGIGSGELLVILVLALVLVGPQKLPDLLRAFGKGYAEFRRMTSDVRTTLEREIEKIDDAKRIEETKKELFGDDAATPEMAVAAETASESAVAAAGNVASGTESSEAVAGVTVASETAAAESTVPGTVASETAAAEAPEAVVAVHSEVRTADAAPTPAAAGDQPPESVQAEPGLAPLAQEKSHA